MKTILFIICSTLILRSELNDSSLQLNSISEIKKALNKFQDTAEVINAFGKEFIIENESRSACGMGYSTNVFLKSWSYEKYGIKFIYSTVISGHLNEKDDFEITSNKNGMNIILDSTAEIKIYNLSLNKSKFKDLLKLRTKGVWIERNHDKKYHFEYVTKYVAFETELINENIVDSLKLDSEDKSKMNEFFGERKIKKVKIGNNINHYKRLMKN